MTERRLLSRRGGRVEIAHLDAADGVLAIETREDCAPIAAAARTIAERPPGRDFRHAAFVPSHVLDRAFREGWFHDAAAWKRWANDAENRAFRSWGGRL